jgi:hypothetical protein
MKPSYRKSLERELGRYIIALKDYRSKVRRELNGTDQGFCNYFNYKFNLYTFDSRVFARNFPTLWSLRPSIDEVPDFSYWWRKGCKEPRKRVLALAISKLNEKLATDV